MLTAEYLRSILHYDPETGIFVWKMRPITRPHDKTWNARFAGTVAGATNNHGYAQIHITNAIYGSQRLAWLWMTGEWPAEQIDHRNGRKGDNRWCNIREATRAQNMHNVGIQRHNTSGYKGVSFHKGDRKWRARHWKDGRYVFVGNFDTPEEASAAYQAAIAYRGEYRPLERAA